ncbi:MAG: Na+/H+ antiporter subunit E [Thiohalospira sp.]
MIRVLMKAALLFVLWLLLTDAAVAGLPFGVAAAVLGALVLPGGGNWPLSPGGWLLFIPWFLLRSVAGGWDVLRRTVQPARPLDPDWVEYETTLTRPAARHLMAAVVGLLPGTLVARLDGHHLRVHALDRSLPVAADLAVLERRIAALFGDVP